MHIVFFLTTLGFFITIIIAAIGKISGVFSDKKLIFYVLFLVLIGFAVLFLSNSLLLSFYHVLIMIFFLFTSSFLFTRLRKRKFMIETGGKIILVATFLTTLALYLTPLVESTVWLVILLLFLPGIVIVYQFLFYFPRELYDDFYLNKISQIRKNKAGTVIIFHSFLPISAYITKDMYVKKGIYISPSGNLRDIYKKLIDMAKNKKSILITQIKGNIKNTFFSLKSDVIIEITQLDPIILSTLSKKVKIIQPLNGKFSKKEMNRLVVHFAK